MASRSLYLQKGKAIAVALPTIQAATTPPNRGFLRSPRQTADVRAWLRTNIKRLTMICVHNLIGARNNAQTSRTDTPGVVDYAYLIKQLERTLRRRAYCPGVIDHLFQETIISVLLANGLDPHVRNCTPEQKHYGLVEDMRDFYSGGKPTIRQSAFFRSSTVNHGLRPMRTEYTALAVMVCTRSSDVSRAAAKSIRYVSERLTEQMLKMFGSRSG